jgi:hypothetical protein
VVGEWRKGRGNILQDLLVVESTNVMRTRRKLLSDKQNMVLFLSLNAPGNLCNILKMCSKRHVSACDRLQQMCIAQLSDLLLC